RGPGRAGTRGVHARPRGRGSGPAHVHRACLPAPEAGLPPQRARAERRGAGHAGHALAAGAGLSRPGAWGPPRYRVYDLRLATHAAFRSAVARILDAEDVGSCAVEPEQRRVRFIAGRRCADSLVRTIYAEGGLSWCSRHDWRPVQTAPAVAPEVS